MRIPRWPVAVAAALVLLGAVSVRTAMAASSGSDHSADPAAPGPFAVSAAVYTLGDTTFHVSGFHADLDSAKLADIELTGIVHYPRGLPGGRRPVVVLSHGLWDTCAD